MENKIIINYADERSILQYKNFYLKYLLKIKNKQQILTELYQICLKFSTLEPQMVFVRNSERDDFEIETEKFILKNFGEDVYAIYNKELPKAKIEKDRLSLDNSFWLLLIEAFARSFEELREDNKKRWKYQKNVLNFIYNCLYHNGLHSDILKRNDVLEKRFNLVLYHFYRSKVQQTDWKILMTYEQFDNDFISQYIKQKPIKIVGKLIPFESISEVKITTTLLKDDEIKLFAIKNNFKWTDREKDIFAFIENSIDETETYHPNPFDERTHLKGLNRMLIEETRQWLIGYPTSFNLFHKAIEKFEKENYERNVLDDLRLSLESLLRELLNNNKSLENQLSEVGNYQKSRSATNEATNMLQKLLDYYNKYQNNYVKHNDAVHKSEVEFVIDLTTTFMKYLIKK